MNHHQNRVEVWKIGLGWLKGGDQEGWSWKEKGIKRKNTLQYLSNRKKIMKLQLPSWLGLDTSLEGITKKVTRYFFCNYIQKLILGEGWIKWIMSSYNYIYENVKLEVAKNKFKLERNHCNFSWVIGKGGLGYKKVKLLTQLISGLIIGMSQSSRAFISGRPCIGPEVDTET